jgi:hypothetical protein
MASSIRHSMTPMQSWIKHLTKDSIIIRMEVLHQSKDKSLSKKLSPQSQRFTKLNQWKPKLGIEIQATGRMIIWVMIPISLIKFRYQWHYKKVKLLVIQLPGCCHDSEAEVFKPAQYTVDLNPSELGINLFKFGQCQEATYEEHELNALR